jgi:hypothetical protein
VKINDLKFPRLKSFLENRTAEVQAVLLICILAIVRMVVALVLDFSKSERSIAEIITDSSIFIVFVLLFILAQRKLTFQGVHPIFGVLIVLLLGINFLQFGGVDGTNCFNYYAGIYVIVMLYSGRRLYILVAVQLIFLALLIYLVFIKHPVYEALLINVTKSSVEFVFSVVSISYFAFYLKLVTVSEIEKLELKVQEVRSKVRESKILNQELIAQSRELKKAQKHLMAEVSLRARDIESQNEAIEQYIYHNTDTLQGPLNHLSTAVSEFKGETQLHTLLRVSHAELTHVITGINQTLQSDAELNRGVIKRKQ